MSFMINDTVPHSRLGTGIILYLLVLCLLIDPCIQLNFFVFIWIFIVWKCTSKKFTVIYLFLRGINHYYFSCNNLLPWNVITLLLTVVIFMLYWYLASYKDLCKLSSLLEILSWPSANRNGITYFLLKCYK